MPMLDPEIASCNALVIDGNPTSRSILASQLRDMGVENVSQVSRIQDGRKLLEFREYDIVLCEQHFPAGASGNDLLDDLRRAQLLPYKTVFVMVTGEADYDKVAEAAESALDGYVLKPHTASGLAQRLRHARQRKRELKDIFDALEAQCFDEAARLCLQRFCERRRYWLYAARIGAELLLRLEKYEAAQQLYEAVIAAKALPWARLGVARAQIDANQPVQARRTLDALILDEPGYADAYDVLGRVQLEQGQLAEALATYRQASALTPGSLSRLQKQGMLAFYMGEHDESARALERAAALGLSSRSFDHQSLVLLAFARFAQADAKALHRCLQSLQRGLERAPDNRRLARFVHVVRVLELMLAKQLAAVIAELRRLSDDLRDDDFDFEAACNTLALIATLAAAELALPDAPAWVDTLALRFCTSKGLAELLARAAQRHPPYGERVRQGHAWLTDVAEKAMAHSLNGRPAVTVRELLMHARHTLNAKLIETARLTLEHHHDRIAEATQLSSEVDALRARFRLAGQALGNAQARSAGAVALRASASFSPLRTATAEPAATAP